MPQQKCHWNILEHAVDKYITKLYIVYDLVRKTHLAIGSDCLCSPWLPMLSVNSYVDRFFQIWPIKVYKITSLQVYNHLLWMKAVLSHNFVATTFPLIGKATIVVTFTLFGRQPAYGRLTNVVNLKIIIMRKYKFPWDCYSFTLWIMCYRDECNTLSKLYHLTFSYRLFNTVI